MTYHERDLDLEKEQHETNNSKRTGPSVTAILMTLAMILAAGIAFLKIFVIGQ